MYAAYQSKGPARPIARTAAFTKEDDLLVDMARQNNLRGRILTYCVAGTFGLLSPNYLHASAATANWDINQIENQWTERELGRRHQRICSRHRTNSCGHEDLSIRAFQGIWRIATSST
jgi:hypothetical protein